MAVNRNAVFSATRSTHFFAAEGHARVMAWLVLFGRAPKASARGGAQKPLQRVLELAQRARAKAHPEREIDYEDTRFRAHLTALALLGDTIFGDLIRGASGGRSGPEAARDFRRRLAQLLADTE